jgi:hypothetical protein
MRILYSAPACLGRGAWPCIQCVDISDLNAVRNSFGAEGARDIPDDDFPFDGKVNIWNLNAVRIHFGESAAQ